MFNVRLAGGHLYGKQLFTWLSLVVSFMASFVLSFFPLDFLDGVWDLIESFSEGFLTYSQLSSRSHPRHLVGKGTAQKDTIIDITSDSQVNSNFPYRWSPASLASDPQKLTQSSSRSHPRHLVGKKDSTKKTPS